MFFHRGENALDRTTFGVGEQDVSKEGISPSYLWTTKTSPLVVIRILTAWAGGFFRAGGHWPCTKLTKAVSPIERDSISRWKRASGDRKTFALKVIPAISFPFLTPLPATPLVQIDFLEAHQPGCLKCSHAPVRQLVTGQTNTRASLWEEKRIHQFCRLPGWKVAWFTSNRQWRGVGPYGSSDFHKEILHKNKLFKCHGFPLKLRTHPWENYLQEKWQRFCYPVGLVTILS